MLWVLVSEWHGSMMMHTAKSSAFVQKRPWFLTVAMLMIGFVQVVVPLKIPSALDAPTVPPCMHLQEAAQQSYQAAQGVEQPNCALPESPEWQRLVLLAMQDVTLDSEFMQAIIGVLEVLLQHTAKNSGCHQLMRSLTHPPLAWQYWSTTASFTAGIVWTTHQMSIVMPCHARRYKHAAWGRLLWSHLGFGLVWLSTAEHQTPLPWHSEQASLATRDLGHTHLAPVLERVINRYIIRCMYSRIVCTRT